MSQGEQLLEVQRHDTTIDQLDHKRKTLPEREQLRSAMDAIAGIDRALIDVDERRGELARAQKRLEDEIASLGEKAAQADKKLYSGTVTVPKELQALQDDVDHIKARIRQLEDSELEIMEQAEPVDAEREKLVGQRAALDVEAQGHTATIAEAEVEIDAEIAGVRAERDAAAAPVPDSVLDEYERLRGRFGGIAVARLNGSSCGGCHLQLSAVEIDRIKGLPLDEPVTCEECGRLLVRS